ncbi:MAG TPA: protein translocase subunit SecD [Solirubrobacteraceae bacterium]|jgi:SecD/SecF fusion protein|nr:protein translocase subunit SecD [Solirubrobacteraceae bacterium]
MSERARHIFVLTVVTVLVLVSLLGVVGIPGAVKAQKTRLGLDLKGGTQLTFKAVTLAGKNPTASQLSDAINIMRSRIDQIGVSGNEITSYGGNEITVSLPDITNSAQAAKIVGVAGQLYFYDWEASVIAPNGKPAGANQQNVTCGASSSSSGNPAGCGISYYKAVIRASKQPEHIYPNAGERVPVYYYVNDKAKKVYPVGPEPTLALLKADVTEHHVKLAAGTRVVAVKPGSVVIQATSAPGVLVPNDYYVLRDDPVLTGKSISNPQENTDPTNGVVVTFGFKGNGGSIFQKVTKTLAQRGQANSPPNETANLQHFAVTLDGALVVVPSIDFTQYPDGINSSNGSEISGGFTFASATTLANTLASGALPVKLNEISSRTITATLGHQALNQGLVAGGVGLLLVVLFLLVFYRVLGIIAVTALAVYALYFYALIKVIPVTLTLPGIAGLILTIGVAADANVVIFERVKEESRAGRSPLNAITAGYRRGFSAIVDANVVTFMAAFILFILSQSDVQGFALTLGIGVLVSLFTAVAATRAILGTMGRTRAIRAPSALGVSKRRRSWTFDFMGSSRWFFTLSGTILLIGAVAIGARGVNFGIDFVSGTQIQVSLKHRATVAQVQSAVGSLHLKSQGQAIGVPVVQGTGSTAKGSKQTDSFQITTKTLTAEQIGSAGSTNKTVYGLLNQRYGIVASTFNENSVGASFGNTVANSAAIAIIASLAAIFIYVALRFQWKYAVPVMIALMHDLLITAGVYALTGRQVTADTVAALLTILGYSMYDTIIVFDRVRENVQKMQNAAFSQIVNRSMSEVLTRSLATSLCTLLPILALLLFGGSTLKDFAFALLVGVASGAYSSIFIASPVLTHWKEREPVYRRRRARIATENGGVVPAYATAGAAAREVTPTDSRRRPPRRLTEPGRPDGAVAASEFRQMVEELHTEPTRQRTAEPEPPPVQDPTADARPEDVVMPNERPQRSRGGAKSRSRRRGRPR